jgi:hypothetical protein
MQDSKVSTSSRERRQQVIAMRLPRIHSRGYEIPILMLKT